MIEFGTELDLHHFHPKDTIPVINEFFLYAKKMKYSKVKIIHGKGKSKKKEEVYRILESHPDVTAFCNDGINWGATIVTLQK